MSDHSGRPVRRPLAQPFSHPDAAVDQSLGERLLPVERSPFSVPAPDEAGAGLDQVPAQGGRRHLGPGGIAAQTPA
ncbi:hypothetical protein ABZW30_42345 [Kitasatospora sp. NPDC004669]|uniref:hypothetical protein n=1 Tax=Kitasatospora sp. NPDC004669 TaxID=3154555 RepID=UPI0033AADAA6